MFIIKAIEILIFQRICKIFFCIILLTYKNNELKWILLNYKWGYWENKSLKLLIQDLVKNI